MKANSRMTNDECQMTKEFRNPKSEIRTPSGEAISAPREHMGFMASNIVVTPLRSGRVDTLSTNRRTQFLRKARGSCSLNTGQVAIGSWAGKIHSDADSGIGDPVGQNACIEPLPVL